MRRQAESLKEDLEVATQNLQAEIEKCKEIKQKSEWELQEKERQALSRIEEARGQISMQWEDKLMDEMARLKTELEQVGLEEKQSALNKMRTEYEDELVLLQVKFTSKQEELEAEIASAKEMVAKKQEEYNELQAKTDTQIVESRMFIQRAERENQAVLDREIEKRENIIGNLFSFFF